MVLKSLSVGVTSVKRSQRFYPAFLAMLVFVIPCFPQTVFAVSPMPYELEKDLENQATEKIKPTEDDTICTIKIVCSKDKLQTDEHVSTIAIRPPVTRKEAVEKSISYVEDRLHNEYISEITVDCKFPVFKQKK